MKNKKIIYLLIISLFVSIVSGCQLEKGEEKETKNNQTSTQEPKSVPELGGEIILPLTTFNTLNPLLTENSSYYFLSKLIFEGLFQFGKDLNVEPQLIESYEVLENGFKIKIKLKENVLWHDGERFTSEDVEFTVNAIKYANANSIYKGMFDESAGAFTPSDIRRILSVDIIDENNLSINFDRSFSNNLEVLTFPIIPKHKFSNDKNYANALQAEDYTPIGTGPFKFESYEKMKQMVLTANEHFREGRPYIDKVIGRVFDSEEDILQAFETGEVNVATTIGIDWDKYTHEDRIRTVEFISSNYEFLGYNFKNNVFSSEIGKDIRKAITYAIDRDQVIEKIYLGHGTQIDVPIHPNSWLISEEANQYGYNLDMAKKILRDIGLTDSNGDGILEKDGKNLSFKLLTNTYNPLRNKTAKKIQEDLKSLGIEVKIYPEINEEKEDEVSKENIENQWLEINKEIKNGNYDIVLSGWKLSVIPDLSFAFHSSQIKYGTNIINYSNAEMDKLLQTVFLNGTREDKKQAYKKLQEFITEEVPYTSLLFKDKVLLMDSKIKGEIEPSFFNMYKGIEKLYIPKQLQ